MIDPDADAVSREPTRDADLAPLHLRRLLASDDAPDIFALLFYMQQPIEYRLPVLATTVLPHLSARVAAWPPTLQLQLASTLHLLLSSSVRASAANAALASSLALLSGDPAHALLQPWGRLLAAALPLVDWASVPAFDSVHALLVEFAQHPDSAFRRVAAAALGPLAAAHASASADELLLDSVHALSHDEDARVRAALAASLAALADALPLHADPDPPLWPVFLVLLRDADAPTQAAAVQSFAKAVHAASHPSFAASSSGTGPLSDASPASATSALSPSLQKTALSVFMTECSLARILVDNPRSRLPAEVGALLRALADAFGPMLHALSPALSDRQLAQAFSSYCALAGFPHATVRRAAAFNFPAVAAVVGPPYARVLADLVELWMRDDDARVRASLAAGLHVVAAALARTPAVRVVLRAAVRLLDDGPSVRDKLTVRLASLLAPVCRDARAVASAFVAEVCTVLRRAQGGSWRAQLALVEQLRRAADFLPECTLLEHVLPTVLELARRSCFTVRTRCTALAARVVSLLRGPDEREAGVTRLVSQWARADVCKRRVAFVEFCAAALSSHDLGADERARSLCELELVALCKDRVSNVRLRVAHTVRAGAGDWLGDVTYATIVQALVDDVDEEVRAVALNANGERGVRGGGGGGGGGGCGGGGCGGVGGVGSMVGVYCDSGDKECDKERGNEVENASDENAGHACNRDEDHVPTKGATDVLVVGVGVGGASV